MLWILGGLVGGNPRYVMSPNCLHAIRHVVPGFPCSRVVAEKLCPQIGGNATSEANKQVEWDDWNVRPLSQSMIHHAGVVGAGVLLDIRKVFARQDVTGGCSCSLP